MGEYRMKMKTNKNTLQNIMVISINDLRQNQNLKF